MVDLGGVSRNCFFAATEVSMQILLLKRRIVDRPGTLHDHLLALVPSAPVDDHAASVSLQRTPTVLRRPSL